ncbi:hypothetical protein KGA66_06025 [Actinocrinis puniceicyclus]|uniref:Uncharacterized protein n=1 Tax=Actinocrinis puniceicyclus TaxID=977794 RepID=A0A8J7WHY3_9ACTN|nr:hypothetical protein [Actinocrinis puniceicyclus]MBS2962596.1 hypothetical protein [Actinocrinis puniceicyclus]
MTVVEGTARDAAKAPIPYAQVRITLVTGTAGLPGYTTDGELIAPHTVKADETGAWSIDLPPTNSITPANTYFEFWESGAYSTVQVPDSSGPYQLKDVSVPITLPDVEAVLTGWLAAQLPGTRACTSLPADLAGSVPLLQVRRVSGAVSHRNQDTAFVDLNAFTADDTGASQLAIAAETLLLGSVNVTAGGAVIRNTGSVVRPRWLPYADTSVQLYAATYEIRLHSVPA